MSEYRAHFDARVQFVNGGGLTAEGFGLDLPATEVRPGDARTADASPASISAAQISAADVGRLFVRHLGLALVARVEISHLTVLEEQHRGSRGIPAQPSTSSGRLVDLSHSIREGLITYPGLPAPVVTPYLTRTKSRATYAPGTEFAMDIITMIGNTGTYIDSPYHRYENGTDLAGLDLQTLVDQPAEVFHLTDATARGIPAAVFYDRALRGKAVLLHTGWDRHFGTAEYASGAPFLSGEGAAYLVDQGVTLVGIDSLNIDDTQSGGARPAHSALLAAGIHVIEHMTRLDALPASGSTITAVPPKVERFGTFPVRAFARLP